jgi:hypothetical protein
MLVSGIESFGDDRQFCKSLITSKRLRAMPLYTREQSSENDVYDKVFEGEIK